MYRDNKEEVKNFDAILKYLDEKPRPDFGQMCKELNLDSEIVIAYCEKMNAHDLISLMRDDIGRVIEVKIRPKGKKKLHEGGFTKRFEQYQKKQESSEQLEKLQIENLTKTLNQFDKRLVEQSDFHTTSTERNILQTKLIQEQTKLIEHQSTLVKRQKNVIILTCLIALISLIVQIYFALTN